jgi:hypothetical protein
MPPDIVGGAPVCVRDAERLNPSGLVPPSPRSPFIHQSPSTDHNLHLVSPRPISVPGKTAHVYAQAAFSPFSESPPSSVDTDSDDGLSFDSDSATSLDEPLNVLEQVFPTVAFASAVEVKADLWEGAILDESHKGLRTLYVESKSFDAVSLRENVVSLIERADEEFECTGVVFCLNKNNANLGNYFSLAASVLSGFTDNKYQTAETLHSLMYVGGTVVSQPPFAVDSNYVLVGLDV